MKYHKIIEWCPYCDTEVQLKTNKGKQKCPHCGHDILPCSQCDNDTINCDKDCPYTNNKN